jgi:hypothetical protein
MMSDERMVRKVFFKIRSELKDRKIIVTGSGPR